MRLHECRLDLAPGAEGIVKKLAALDPVDFSGHSLRDGRRGPPSRCTLDFGSGADRISRRLLCRPLGVMVSRGSERECRLAPGTTLVGATEMDFRKTSSAAEVFSAVCAAAVEPRDDRPPPSITPIDVRIVPHIQEVGP